MKKMNTFFIKQIIRDYFRQACGQDVNREVYKTTRGQRSPLNLRSEPPDLVWMLHQLHRGPDAAWDAVMAAQEQGSG